jgi:hypothetical protein
MTQSFERPEARTESIDDLLKIVKTGKIIIPFFQRNFVWDEKDISNLFDSIYRGYPIGNLLFWKRKMDIPENQIKIGPLKFSKEESGEVEAVVDGQQRLTSLAGVLLLNHATVSAEEKNHWNLHFDLKLERFVFPKKRQNPPSHWLPMSLVADTREYLKWLRNLDDSSELIDTADNVAKAIRDYKIPVYRVESDETEVREIFERLNYMGKPLQPSDIFNAIVCEPKENSSVRIHDIQNILELEGYGIPNNNSLLKAIYAILDIPLYDEARARKKLTESSTKRKLEQLSGTLANIYQRVIHFLRSVAEIDHLLLLPYYNVTLIPLMKIFHCIPKPSVQLQEDLSRWIWRASLSEAHRNPTPSEMKRILDNISENEDQLTAMLKEDFDLNIQNVDHFDVKRFDFRHARVKILCCSWLAQQPTNLVTKEPLDLKTIFTDRGTKAFGYIYPRLPKEYLQMPGNRLLNYGKSSSSVLDEAGKNVSEETLLSHLIDSQAFDYYLNDQKEEFIQHRTRLMNEAAREFLLRKCDIS